MGPLSGRPTNSIASATVRALISQLCRAASSELQFGDGVEPLVDDAGFSSFGPASIAAKASRSRLSDKGDSLVAFARDSLIVGFESGMPFRIGAKDSIGRRKLAREIEASLDRYYLIAGPQTAES